MNSGVVATNSAAIPDGIRFSATPTSEFASMRREPTIAPVRHCGSVARASFRAIAMTSMMSPASPNRIVESTNGGIVSIA